MEIALTVLAIVAPVFLLGSAGFVWAKAGYDYPTAFITRIAMTLAVPCLIFTALMQADIALSTLGALTLASLVAYVAVIGLSWGVVAMLRLDRAAYVAPLAFGNTGNLGLPLALFAFGETGLGLAVVVFAVMAILTFTIGLWLVAGGTSPARMLREPMLWATLLGGLFLTMGWETPEWLTRSLSLMGQMAIPLMLVTLGVAVARLKAGRIGRALWMSAAKLALGIVAGVMAGRAFGLDPVAFGVLVLQMATPVAVTSYLLAERYDADPDAVAGLVMVSTLMSVATLPITLSFLL